MRSLKSFSPNQFGEKLYSFFFLSLYSVPLIALHLGFALKWNLVLTIFNGRNDLFQGGLHVCMKKAHEVREFWAFRANMQVFWAFNPNPRGKEIRAFMPFQCCDEFWVIEPATCDGEFWTPYFEKTDLKPFQIRA